MAIITISRQHGSDGDEIAARVCEMLGYRYFDKNLMAQVASEMGLTEDEVVDFSEESYEPGGFLDRLLGRRRRRVVAQVRTWTEDASGARRVEQELMDEDWAVAVVNSAIQAAYRRDNVVIVGRGGQAVLQEKPGVLHVRIEAPLETRITRVLYREPTGMAPDIERRIARERVTQGDKASGAYLRHFHDIDGSDTALYHLTINNAKMGIEAAAHVIVNAIGYLPPAEPSD